MAYLRFDIFEKFRDEEKAKHGDFRQSLYEASINSISLFKA